MLSRSIITSSGNFTKIPNEYLDALCRTPLPAHENMVLHSVIRYTLGFHRATADLSLSFLERATSIERRNLTRSIKKLVLRNMLLKKTTSGKPSQYSLQTDTGQWRTTTLGGVPTAPTSEMSRGHRYTGSRGHGYTSGRGHGYTQERKEEKENTKKTLPPYGGEERNGQKELLRDSLARECGIKTSSKTSRKRMDRIVNDLSERDATSAAIKARADRYRDRWPAMALTPEALEKHWDSLGRAEHDGAEADEEREKRKVYAPASVPKGVA